MADPYRTCGLPHLITEGRDHACTLDPIANLRVINSRNHDIFSCRIGTEFVEEGKISNLVATAGLERFQRCDRVYRCQVRSATRLWRLDSTVLAASSTCFPCSGSSDHPFPMLATVQRAMQRPEVRCSVSSCPFKSATP
jgi:hypothetical protein